MLGAGGAASAAAAGPRPTLRKFFTKKGEKRAALDAHEAASGAAAAAAAEAAAGAAGAADSDGRTANDADYSGWVGARKGEWTKLRAGRKKRRAARTAEIAKYGYVLADAEKEGGGAGLASFGFQRQSAKLGAGQRWDLIQVVEDAPGRYLAWALVGGATLQKVWLSVPRVVYVNSIDERPELEVRRPPPPGLNTARRTGR